MTVHRVDRDPSYIETLTEFIELYDSSWQEVAMSVPESVQDDLLEWENIQRTEEHGEAADAVTEIDEVRDELVESHLDRPFQLAVEDVLSRRVGEYAVFWDDNHFRVAEVIDHPDHEQDGHGTLYGYECIVGTGITRETTNVADPEAVAVAQATSIIKDHLPGATIGSVVTYDGGGVGIDVQVERPLDYDTMMEEIEALESFHEFSLERV